ncbi:MULTISPECIES: hypothetical protein [unclassified Corynebacterium]|uniref:hypothetical protein n=1 Tax=unclassified Corynebacterium TaxID=2624378 RepID=UPI00309FFB95
MSYLQPYQQNPIELRKQAVRKHSRNAVLWSTGGIIGGVAIGLMAQSFVLMAMIIGIGIIGGLVNWQKVQKIVNHKDNQ